MDPQAPNVPSITPKAASTEVPSSQTPKDNHGITIFAMAIFVLLSLGAVAFLYYQNQQLKGMLASYQTPVASPTPSPAEASAQEGTANWKTYTNSKFGVSFKYPNNFNSTEETSLGDPLFRVHIEDSQNQAVGFNFEVWSESTNSAIQKIKSESAQAAPPITNIPQSEVKFNNISATKLILTSDKLESQGVTFIIKNGLKSYVLSFETLPDNNVWVDQILSTFKFISPTSSPIPTKIPVPVSTSSAVPSGY